ncbi:ring finger domain protein [Ophiostoma piceae UAMH 11346]|uniref:RING-type E3 ubiquitin transferase n=1 Tax=Ophiostoma piceae (strain UAMH 11346) TaxID=1262450 RepID=S3BVB0_OPHP1|nr:ring finger domain protein [Ophiostoma piceae UAMH 11346]
MDIVAGIRPAVATAGEVDIEKLAVAMASTVCDSPTRTETDAAPDVTLAAEQKPAGAEAEADSCVFCLEPASQLCVARPCGHRCFDFLCLTSWLLEYHPTCPLCKSQVSTVEYGDELEYRLDVKKESHKRKFDLARAEHVSTERSRSYQQRSRTVNAGPTPDRPVHAGRAGQSGAPLGRLSRGPDIATPEDDALEERRRVYRHGLYARHIGSNGRSRHYQDLTPSMFQQDPDLTSRARSFIRRELQVLWREHAPEPASEPARVPHPSRGPYGLFTRHRAGRNRHQLIEHIVLILKSLDIQSNGSGIEDVLARDLGSASVVRHFLHELRCFLRSPYLTVTAWDRHVQYGRSRLEDDNDYDDDDDDSGSDSELDRRERRQRREQLRADIAQRDEWFQPRRYPGGTRAPYLVHANRPSRHGRIHAATSR